MDKFMEKFYTKISLMKGIDDTNVNDFIFLSQDSVPKYDINGTTGAKQFYFFRREHLEQFIDTTMKENQNLYELVVSDEKKLGKTLVRPYFDLDMEHTGTLAQKMGILKTFINWLKVFFTRMTSDLDCDIELLDENFVVLDSCREDKLSFHIYVVDSFYFSSMSEHKVFIERMEYEWKYTTNETERELFKTMTWMKGKQDKFIFDTIPYSSFQSFRLPFQSKRGKTNILRPIDGYCNDMSKAFIRLSTSNEDVSFIDNLFQVPNIVIPPSPPEYDASGNEITYEQGYKITTHKVTNKKTFEPFSQWDLRMLNKFQKNGLTLYDKFIQTGMFKDIYDLKSFPKWKQALYLIPNGISADGIDGTQDWKAYFLITSNIAWNGGTLEDALNWCHLAYTDKNGFSDDTVERDFQSYAVKDTPPIVSFLEKIVQKNNPGIFSLISRFEFDEFLKLKIDETEMKVIIEHEKTQFVSDANAEFKGDRDNIFDPAKILIIHAGMGRGKTRAIKRMLHNDEREEYDRAKREHDEERDKKAKELEVIRQRNKNKQISYNRKVNERKKKRDVFLKMFGKVDDKEEPIPEPILIPEIEVPEPFQERVFPNSYDSVLFLSSRISFAEFVGAEFNFRVYTDAKEEAKTIMEKSKDKLTIKDKRLVCSVESLCFIDRMYELVVIDESESVMKQMNSDTLFDPLDAFRRLLDLCCFAKKVIIADAFISEVSLNLAREIAKCSTDKSITYLRNKYLIQNKVMIELPKFNEFIKNKGEAGVTETKVEINMFYNKLEDTLRKGGKVFVCFGSANELNNTVLSLKSVGLIHDDPKDFISIWSKGDDVDFNSSKQMNEVWATKKFIGVSPSITIGMSFDLKDVFDFTMICFAPTCPVRDAFQSHMRVRYTIGNVVYFQYPDEFHLSRAKARQNEFKENMKALDTYLHKTVKSTGAEFLSWVADYAHLSETEQELKSKIFKYYRKVLKERRELITPAFQRNYILCLKEDIFCAYFYQEMVAHFAKECGYNFKSAKKQDKISKRLNVDVPIEDPTHYRNLASLEYQEDADLLAFRKGRRDDVTAVEKAQLDKFWFDTLISQSLPLEKREELFSIYRKDHQRYIFENVRDEMNKVPYKRLMKKDAEELNVFKYKSRSAQLRHILKLNELLNVGAKKEVKQITVPKKLVRSGGPVVTNEPEPKDEPDESNEIDELEYDSSFCSYEGGYCFTRQFFESDDKGKPLYEYLEKNYKSMCLKSVFNISSKSKPVRTVQFIKYALNAIYGNWSGLSFENDEDSRDKKTKKYDLFYTETTLCRNMFAPIRPIEKLEKEEENFYIDTRRYTNGTCFIRIGNKDEYQDYLKGRLREDTRTICIKYETVNKHLSYGLLCSRDNPDAVEVTLKAEVFVIRNGLEIGEYFEDKKIVLFYDDD